MRYRRVLGTATWLVVGCLFGHSIAAAAVMPFFGIRVASVSDAATVGLWEYHFASLAALGVLLPALSRLRRFAAVRPSLAFLGGLHAGITLNLLAFPVDAALTLTSDVTTAAARFLTGAIYGLLLIWATTTTAPCSVPTFFCRVLAANPWPRSMGLAAVVTGTAILQAMVMGRDLPASLGEASGGWIARRLLGFTAWPLWLTNISALVGLRITGCGHVRVSAVCVAVLPLLLLYFLVS